jgi:xanthosine utilization system XapX-like protein
MIAGTSIRAAWQQMRCGQHVFGAMPGRLAETPAATRIATVRELQS